MIEVHVPLKKLSKKQIKSQRKPWITINIKKSILSRDNLLKKYLKAKGERRTTFNNNLKNSKKIWSGINDLISSKSKSKRKSSTISLDVNGNLTSDKKLIAESFNKYFTEIAEKIKKNLPSTKRSYREYLDEPCRNFFFTPTTPDEVKNIIMSLDTSKATGPYSIPCQVLNALPTEISTILSEIFNQSFKTGKFPQALKYVKVVPIYKKKGSPFDTGN